MARPEAGTRNNQKSISRLRDRVEELEETLRAIQSGSVDALVVTDPSGGFQVYTLQGAEHPYRVMVESIREGAATLDADGNILYANGRLGELLGVPLEQLIGTTLQSRVPAQDRSGLESLIESGKRRAATCELSAVDGTGIRRVLRVSLTPFRSSGTEVLCALVTEVTELVEALEAQRRSEVKLQALSGRLLKLQDEERRRISRDLHDVTGQNLAALNLTLSELELLCFSKPGPETQKLLQQCRSLSEQISQEIRTLSYMLHPPLLDEVGLAAAVRWYANGFAQRTGLQVEIETAPNLARLPQNAEIALFRVLQESLGNIHRYSESESAFIRLGMKAGAVRLEVEDKGKGIPPEDLKAKGASLGVGIQGMRERMRQLSGTLEIVSHSGAGTRVIASVPLPSHSFEGQHHHDASGGESAGQNGSNGHGGGTARRVLIADDHEMLREGIRRVLQKKREWVVCGEAANGKEAVEQAASLKPDLVILDLSMPILNGLEALKLIRQKCPATKVLVFTVNNSEHVVREIHAAGADGYLCKSNAAQDLVETLNGLFEAERSLHSAASHS